jgi:CheY-like chemotaxis protein
MSRVLMVDDAGLFQILEGSFLRRLGCEIVRAHDGPDIVEKAAACAPDLILLDADGPSLDGEACLRSLKSDPTLRSIPVLVVTSTTGMRWCCDAGADATVTRPVTRGALDLAVRSLGRVSPRLGLRRTARVPVRIASSCGSLRGRLKDISRSGLFLVLPAPLPMNAQVELSLKLPGPEGGLRVRTHGVVVRQVIQDAESHLIPGVGVRFVELDSGTEMAIDHYVRRTISGPDAAGPAQGTVRGRT